MPLPAPEPFRLLPPLLLRRATGSGAAAVVAGLTRGARPGLVTRAARDDAVVLWLGDVAIHDAVPLAAAILTVRDGDASLVGVVGTAGWPDHSLGARLARDVVAECRARGCRRLLAPDPPGDDGETTVFRRRLAAGLVARRVPGGWAIEV
jgi:hypothetical protein